MRNLFLALVLLGAGVAGGYLYSQSVAESVEITVTGMISEPRAVQRLEMVEVIAQNMAVAIKENKFLGRENNAAYMRQWQSVSQIGVDFTGFDWKAKVKGIGVKLPESGQILVAGVLPPIQVLHTYSINEKDTPISRIMGGLQGYNEEARLVPLLKLQQKIVSDCIASRALDRLETIELAKTFVVSMLEMAIPLRDDGTSPVRFDLTFENEEEIRTAADQRSQADVACEATIKDE
jgi:hypothetical protein